MGLAELEIVFSLAEFALGIVYFLFGKGPKIPNCPRWLIAIGRLSIPLFLISASLLQENRA